MPRWSPPTTVPSTSSGRPSSAAAPATSPAAASSRIRVEETPSTSGTSTTSRPSERSSSRSPPRLWPKRKPCARRDPLGTDREQVAARELLGRERGGLGRELDDEHVLHPGLVEQLEPPLERREQRDLAAEHRPRVRMEGDDRRRAARRAPRRAPRGGRGGRRRRCRSRPTAAAARARPGAAGDVHRASTPSRTATGTRVEGVRAAAGRGCSATGQEQRLVDGRGLGDVERADLGAAQARAVAAERRRDRADVRAGADAEVEPHATPRRRSRTSSAWTTERRSGISTSTPCRASR